MPWGYGSGGSSGRNVGTAPMPQPPAGTDGQRIARATEALADKQAPPNYQLWTPVTLNNAGDALYIDSQTSDVTMLTVQVFSGVLDIMLGDYRNQGDPPIPYWRVGAIGVPVHIPLPTRPRDITVFANQPSTLASVLLHTPS